MGNNSGHTWLILIVLYILASGLFRPPYFWFIPGEVIFSMLAWLIVLVTAGLIVSYAWILIPLVLLTFMGIGLRREIRKLWQEFRNPTGTKSK